MHEDVSDYSGNYQPAKDPVTVFRLRYVCMYVCMHDNETICISIRHYMYDYIGVHQPAKDPVTVFCLRYVRM